ncbi:sensor histidine kinase [Chitinophaga rhizophila]|uniref:histidine kinase n=1 Tax=Chitinophaga rhizophila TaxID=2866212 RepID=A0ABS7GKH5_9BACT|nr:histidine kinase dimerization/phosphoacceptor domain -containing protein [Chitinophaga rhizophila]MBW8687891.1 ATP-binding protein [Chitinophaga rhizophila]
MYRHILFCWLLLTSVISSHAQVLHNPVPPTYNADLQRFLVQTTANFLYAACQGQMDKDSTMLYTTGIFRLSRLTPYNEGYKTGKEFIGRDLIDSGKIQDAEKALAKLQSIPRLQLLAELANYYLHKPGADPKDLEMADRYANMLLEASKTLKDNFWLMQSYWILGGKAAQEMNIPKSQIYFNEAVTLCKQTDNQPLLGACLLYQADALPPGMPQKDSLFGEATAIARKNKLVILEHRIIQVASFEHLRMRPADVEKEILRALEIQKGLGFLHHQYCYYTLSYLYTLKADAVLGLRYAEEAIKYATATKDTALATLYYLRIAQMYGNVDNTSNAFFWIDKSLQGPLTPETKILWFKSFTYKVVLFRRVKMPARSLKLIDSINTHLPPNNALDRMLLASETAAAYDAMGNEPKALESYLYFLEMAKRFPPQFMFAETLMAYNQLGNFYFKTGKYIQAREYATLTLAHPLAGASAADLARTHNLLFRIDSAEGNYTSAIGHLQQYHLYTDSVYSIIQRKQMADLTVKYETQKKDQDIRILKQDSQLQKAKLSRSSMIGNITLGGIILLLIIVTLLYNQYRIKRKASQDALSRNRVLQQLLNEKEWLLREVHHRVKNNLQTIVSLLESQSAYLENEALLAIQESQNRIHAMSLIHQKLYHNENVASVDMSTYLPELVYYLRQSYNVKNTIGFNVQVDELELDVSQAIPLGLIVNEAVTNAIKYAFPKAETGQRIHITLRSTEESATLSIQDNGIGITNEVLYGKVWGLGLKLIRGLSKDIDGELDINSRQGTAINITFAISVPLTNAASEVSSTAVN